MPTLEADGHTIEYAMFGSGAAQPIVLLHEGLGSLGLWRDFPQALAKRTARPVVAYSRYGNGFSDPLEEPREPDFMHREALVTLPELLEQLQITRPVLFGHSDGASIAAIYGGAFPEDVQALILEAPHLFVEDLTIASIRGITNGWENGLGRRMQRHHRDARKTFFGWSDIWLHPDFRAWEITAYAAQIHAPVLLLQGREDQYGSEEQVRIFQEAMKERVRTVMLEACGHAPHQDQAEKVLSAVREFLDEIDRRDPVPSA